MKRVVRETPDAVSLVFEVPEELADLYQYRAGQFVTLDPPLSSEALLRCYSMSSAADVDPDLRITVKRVSGGRVSNWLNDAVTEGSSLAVSRPAGRFLLTDSEREVVLFAGGSGIVPIYSLAKSLLAGSQRSARLLYANREEASVIFGCQLTALERRHPDRFRVVHHLDSERGYVTVDEVRTFAGDGDAEYYICGPLPFMDIVEQGLAELGVGEERIHTERFTVDESNVGLPPIHVPEQVEISATVGGRSETFQYRAGLSLLHAVRGAGLGPPSSCELGTCGTCMARVVEGEASMRHNIVLSDEEIAEGWVLTCQALPTSPVIRLVYD